MYLPDIIFKNIISFIPKHFILNKDNKSTILHKLCINKNCQKSINKIKKLVNEYSLYDFNYLQDYYGHTPLHVAYQYSNYEIVDLLEKKYPKMKEIKSFTGELPIKQKDIYIRTRNEHEE